MKKAPPPAKGRLFICGTGISLPGDLTQETLRVLGACDTVFYLHADGERLQRTLQPLCAGLRLTLLDHAKTPHRELFRRVREELDRGRDTAYLTYGSPLLFSEGEQLAWHCGLHSIPFRVVPAPSSVESVLGALAERGLWVRGEGYCALRPKNLLASPDSFSARHMLLVFCAHEELAQYGDKFWRALARRYPARHPVYLVAADPSGGATRCEATTAARLREQADRAEHRMTIVLPALPARSAAGRLKNEP
jgi:hypothetical protein